MKLKYIGYSRINIDLVETTSTSIEREDKRSVLLICPAPLGLLQSIEERENYVHLYKQVFNCLRVLWVKNNWDVGDLDKIYEEIELNDFRSNIIYGQTLTSHNRKYKAEFRCDLYPEYSDYSIQFLEKLNIIKSVKFLKGHPDPSLFFGYFNVRWWRDNENYLLSEFNKEIYYCFNITSDDFTIDFRPQYNSVEQCQNKIKAFQFDTSHEEMQELLMK